MNEEQINEAMRLGELRATYAWKACSHGASEWAHLQKHDGAQAIGVVFRTGTGSVGSLVDGRVVWADWLACPNGSKSADSEYTDEDMAAVGRALMSAITQYAPKGWSPADCPSEIVGDLHNECEELRSDAERYRKLRDVDAWGEDTAPDGGSAWARLGELHGSEFDAFVDSRAESAIETPAKVSPCAGHAVQQEADDLVGLRGCNSRHGVQRAEEPCIYRMRTTDYGCTGCVERDEDRCDKAARRVRIEWNIGGTSGHGKWFDRSNRSALMVQCLEMSIKHGVGSHRIVDEDQSGEAGYEND